MQQEMTQHVTVPAEKMHGPRYTSEAVASLARQLTS